MNEGQRIVQATVAAIVMVAVLAVLFTPAPEILWALVRRLWGRYVASIRLSLPPVRSPEVDSEPAVSAEIETSETAKEPVAEPETLRNDLLRDARLVARFVAAGKVSETEALAIAFEVKPGSSARYREAREALKRAQAEIPQFPTLTAEGRPIARALRAS